MAMQDVKGALAAKLANGLLRAANSVPDPTNRGNMIVDALHSTSPVLAKDVMQARAGGMPLQRALVYGYSRWIDAKMAARGLGSYFHWSDYSPWEPWAMGNDKPVSGGGAASYGFRESPFEGSGGGGGGTGGDAVATMEQISAGVSAATDIINEGAALVDAAGRVYAAGERAFGGSSGDAPRRVEVDERLVRLALGPQAVHVPYVGPAWEGGMLDAMPPWLLGLGAGALALGGYYLWKGSKKRGRKK